MNKANIYLLKLWLSTIMLAPIIYGIYELFREIPGQVVSLLEIFPITIAFSFIFSAPTLIVTFVVNKLILNPAFPTWAWKTITVLIALLGVVVTLLIIDGSLMLTLIFTYAISVLSSTLFLELVNRINFKRSI